ncbi:coilin [Drosophila takahashii]|uniref:coilin n=1 Tax=Drosophila takahashii TaxID=29030 RepID=UPI0038996C78
MHHSSMKVDLSNFFKDERRQSLVFIDATWQNIKDVQDHIQNLFSLKDISLLTTDGCFLPPRESIKVLKSAEGLKAFRFANNDKDAFVSPAPVKSSKKRKNRSAEDEVLLDSSTPLRPSKRSKNQNNTKWLKIEGKTSPVRAEEREEEAPGPSVESKRSKNKGSAKTPEIQSEISSATSEEEPTKKKKSSKNKNLHKSSDVRAETLHLTTELQEKGTSASTSTSRCTSKETKMSKNKSLAKSSEIQSEKSITVALEKDEAAQNEYISICKRSKVNSPLESPKIPSETSHLAPLDQIKQSTNTLNRSKNQNYPKSPIISTTAADQEGETSPRPSISFRCPLLELDSNVARSFEIPKKINEVKILEHIVITPISNRYTPRKDKDIAKPVAVNGEKSSTLMLEPESTQEVNVPEKLRETSLPVQAEASLLEDSVAEATLPEDKTETTLQEDIAEAETTRPEEIAEAEPSFPGDSTETEPVFPANSTEVETTLPDDTIEAEETQPVDSNEAESILPDETNEVDTSLPADTSQAENPLAEAEISEIKNEVESDDRKLPPVRICAENVISDSDDDVMVVDDSNMDESDSDSDVEAVPVPKDRNTLDIIRDLLRSATPLSNLPTRGDTVLFKLLKTKGIASSGTTEFIAGNCTYVNRRTKTITVETITCPSGIGRIMRQYYVSGLDESTEEVRSLSVQLKDMIEAKIIVATID